MNEFNQEATDMIASDDFDLAGTLNSNPSNLNLLFTDADATTSIFEEIESLYSDHHQLNHNWPCEHRCARSMLQNKVEGDPNYFFKLAQSALTTSDKKLQDLLLTAGGLGHKSAEVVASTFRSWFDVIFKTTHSNNTNAGSHHQDSLVQLVEDSDASDGDSDTRIGMDAIPHLNYKRSSSSSSSSSIVSGTSSEARTASGYGSTTGTSITSGTSAVSDSDDSDIATVFHRKEQKQQQQQQQQSIRKRQCPFDELYVRRRERGRNIKNSTKATKGVYTTRHGFRVQLSMRPVLNSLSSLHRTDNGNIKFSRNCRDYENALWLYEIIFMISDHPVLLETLILRGNYNELHKLCWPTSTDGQCEYYRALGASINTLRDVGLLKSEEYDEALVAYQNIRPPVMDGTGTPTTTPSTSTLNSISAVVSAVAKDENSKQSY